jgi:hypothetical protein
VGIAGSARPVRHRRGRRVILIPSALPIGPYFSSDVTALFVVVALMPSCLR